jgi:hypothetical protein
MWTTIEVETLATVCGGLGGSRYPMLGPYPQATINALNRGLIRPGQWAAPSGVARRPAFSYVGR